MRCDNVFCIYWADERCSLDKISLDIRGCCENCIYINADDARLEEKRAQLLLKFDNSKTVL